MPLQGSGIVVEVHRTPAPLKIFLLNRSGSDTKIDIDDRGYAAGQATHTM